MSLVGQTIGNYRVTRLLGEGGMGVVYEAEHPVIGRKVAIKLLHVSLASDVEIVARFFNEARAIHTIRHENIVEIMDFGQTADGQPYFIMEFLNGEAINERLTRGAMPPLEVGDIADQICRALAAAHEKGIVHRDLKPHNVQLLATKSGRVHVKLLDFGVAKIMNASDLSQSVKTRTGSLMGTPIYMSPEQCKGAGEIDHRTDIYSLGIMLYEMLAGRPPFVAQGVGELFALHMLQQPPPLTDFAPRTPPAMAAAVMRSLAKNPGDRFASMEALRVAFLQGLPVGATQAEADAAMSGRTHTYRSSPGANPGANPGARSGSRPGGTMPLPAQAATTLSSAPRELDDDPAPPRKGRAGLLIATVALAAAGVGTYLVLGKGAGKGAERGDGDDPTRSHSGVGVTAADKSPANGTDSPAISRTVTIRFEAQPQGTHVYRVTDDKDLGAVPLELKLPRHGGNPQYVFRLEGYDDRSVSTDLAADQTLRATLEKTAPPAAAAVPPQPSPSPSPSPSRPARTADVDKGGDSTQRRSPPPHRATRKARAAAVGDEDGLATPTF